MIRRQMPSCKASGRSSLLHEVGLLLLLCSLLWSGGNSFSIEEYLFGKRATGPDSVEVSEERHIYGFGSDNPPVLVGVCFPVDLATAQSTTASYVLESKVKTAIDIYLGELMNETGGYIEVNGVRRPLHVVYLSPGSLDVLPRLVESLVQNNRTQDVYLIGPPGQQPLNVVAEAAFQLNALLVAPDGASSAPFGPTRPNLFGFMPPAARWVTEPLQNALYLGVDIKTLVYVQDESSFGLEACHAARVLAENSGLVLLEGINVTSTKPEFATVAKKIAAHKADVLLGCFEGTSLCSPMLDNMVKENVNSKMVIIPNCVLPFEESKYIVTSVAWSPKESRTCEVTGLTTATFKQKFIDASGLPPVTQAVAAFTAISVLVDAIRTVGKSSSGLSTAGVANVLRSYDKQSLFGRVKFSNGQVDRPLIQLQQTSNEVHSVIAPPEFHEEQLLFPMPKLSIHPCLRVIEDGRLRKYKGHIGINGTRYEDHECLPCVPGTTGNLREGNHSADFYLDRLASTHCTACPQGRKQTVASVTQAKCVRCEPGTFAPDKGSNVCLSCGVGEFQDGVGATACDKCPPGRYSGSFGSSGCKRCGKDASGVSLYSALYGNFKCKACPHSADCPEDDQGHVTGYVPRPSYSLVVNEASTREDLLGSRYELGKVVLCPYGYGSSCEGGGKCLKGMQGYLCGECAPGYAKFEPWSVCTECYSMGEAFGLGLLNLILFYGSTILLMTSILMNNPAWQGLTITVVNRILVNYCSMTSFVFPLFRSDVGKYFSFSALFSWVNVVLGVDALPQYSRALSCVLEAWFPQYESWAVMIVVIALSFPAILIIDFLLYRIGRIVARMMGLDWLDWKKMVALIVIQAYLLHARVISGLAFVYYCGDSEANDKKFFIWKPSVLCDSEEYTYWYTVARTTSYLYGLGIPLVLLLITGSLTRMKKLEDPSGYQTFGAIYIGFEPTCWYYELLCMFRKFVLMDIATEPWLFQDFEEGRQEATTAVLILALLILLALHKYMLPFLNRNYRVLDRLETSMLWAIVVTLVTNLWLSISDQSIFFDKQKMDTEVRRLIRDIIGNIIVICFHLRFFYLVTKSLLMDLRKAGVMTAKQSEYIQLVDGGIRVSGLSNSSRIVLAEIMEELGFSYLERFGELSFRFLETSMLRTLAYNFYWKWMEMEHSDLAYDEHRRRLKADMNVQETALALDPDTFMNKGLAQLRSIEKTQIFSARVAEGLDMADEALYAIRGEWFAVDDVHIAMSTVIRHIGRMPTTPDEDFALATQEKERQMAQKAEIEAQRLKKQTEALRQEMLQQTGVLIELSDDRTAVVQREPCLKRCMQKLRNIANDLRMPQQMLLARWGSAQYGDDKITSAHFYAVNCPDIPPKDVTLLVNNLILLNGLVNFTGSRSLVEALGDPAPGRLKKLVVYKNFKSVTFTVRPGKDYWLDTDATMRSTKTTRGGGANGSRRSKASTYRLERHHYDLRALDSPNTKDDVARVLLFVAQQADELLARLDSYFTKVKAIEKEMALEKEMHALLFKERDDGVAALADDDEKREKQEDDKYLDSDDDEEVLNLPLAELLKQNNEMKEAIIETKEDYVDLKKTFAEQLGGVQRDSVRSDPSIDAQFH